MATEIGKFSLKISEMQLPDGTIYYRTDQAQTRIQRVAIIMYLKAILKSLERDFFYDFDQHTATFEKK